MDHAMTEALKTKMEDTGILCVVCSQGTMLVRGAVKRNGSDITQHLECSNCQESYPRVVSSLDGKVLVDPMKKG